MTAVLIGLIYPAGYQIILAEKNFFGESFWEDRKIRSYDLTRSN
jgi:hypothetical protein